jgi:hypothetical protein
MNFPIRAGAVDTFFALIIACPNIIIVTGVIMTLIGITPNIVQIAVGNYKGCLQDATGAGRSFVMIANRRRHMVAFTEVDKILRQMVGYPNVKNRSQN